MRRLWRAGDDAFYLVDEAVELPAGATVIEDLTGQTRKVKAAALAPFAVDEATARDHAEATMARIRDNAKAGIAALRGVAHDVLDRTADLERTTAALRAEAARPRPALDLGPIAEQLGRALGGAGDEIRELLDEDRAATAEGRAWLAQVAQAIKAGGGPDWTADPAGIPGRLRAALGDPALAERLAALGRDVTGRTS